MKKQYTFTIDTEIFKEFDLISKKFSINKSLFVENSMKDHIIHLKDYPIFDWNKKIDKDDNY